MLCVVITDETLEKYIVQELVPCWQKLGKALNVPNDFFEDLSEDPAERLRAVLTKWKRTGVYPSVSTLNKKLQQLGFENFKNKCLRSYNYMPALLATFCF